MVRNILLFLLLVLLTRQLFSQNSPRHIPLGSIQAEKGKPGHQVQKLSETEEVSCFHLTLREDVKLHQHAFHAEHVVVVSGRARMRLGENEITIRKGDLIFIPRNTPHSVALISKELKVLSIQAPLYDGKDRISLEK